MSTISCGNNDKLEHLPSTVHICSTKWKQTNRHRHRDRQTDRQTDGQMDRGTDRQRETFHPRYEVVLSVVMSWRDRTGCSSQRRRHCSGPGSKMLYSGPTGHAYTHTYTDIQTYRQTAIYRQTDRQTDR